MAAKKKDGPEFDGMVRAVQRCFINNRLREPGEEFRYRGNRPDGTVVMPIEDETPRNKPEPPPPPKE